jgi:hypothetical protein
VEEAAQLAGVVDEDVQLAAQGPGAAIMAAMELPTARATVEELLRIYAEAASEPGRPRGCLLVNGAMSCSPEASGIRDELARCRAASVEALARRIDRARRAGELPSTVNATHLARFYWTVLNGMAVGASDGTTTAQMREVAAQAMAAWPGAARPRKARKARKPATA